MHSIHMLNGLVDNFPIQSKLGNFVVFKLRVEGGEAATKLCVVLGESENQSCTGLNCWHFLTSSSTTTGNGCLFNMGKS